MLSVIPHVIEMRVRYIYILHTFFINYSLKLIYNPLFLQDQTQIAGEFWDDGGGDALGLGTVSQIYCSWQFWRRLDIGLEIFWSGSSSTGFLCDCIYFFSRRTLA